MALSLLLTAFLVLMNGFFVAAEFAIVKVRASQLETRIKSGSVTARLARQIVSQLDGYLAATQLGITLASLGLGWVGEPVVSHLIIYLMGAFGFSIEPEMAHKIALPTAFAAITVLHIVFGELAPKSIAIQRSESTTLFVSYPLRFFYVIFKPFIWLLNGIASVILRLLGISAVHGMEIHSSEELKFLVQQGKETGEIEEEDYNIIKNAFNLSERTVRQTMVPSTRLVSLGLTSFNETSLEKIIDEGYSRIPCYEDNPDVITGVIYLKDILVKKQKDKPFQIRDLVRPVMTIPETKRIGQLLKDFQKRHEQIAVVVNEYGTTIGIITMEDILEELVGEIQDEYDNETPVVEATGEQEYLVQASATLEDVNHFLPYRIPKEEDYETLAGYLIYKFGRMPNVDDQIRVDDYLFTVLKKSENTVELVKVEDLSAQEKEGPGLE